MSIVHSLLIKSDRSHLSASKRELAGAKYLLGQELWQNLTSLQDCSSQGWVRPLG
ncbi:MAG: hypothetical protein VKL59_19035 [Nostocaceae cyanobacterium]|nr:hypothetical protein [Nostocaceae cyanobacterium]